MAALLPFAGRQPGAAGPDPWPFSPAEPWNVLSAFSCPRTFKLAGAQISGPCTGSVTVPRGTAFSRSRSRSLCPEPWKPGPPSRILLLGFVDLMKLDSGREGGEVWGECTCTHKGKWSLSAAPVPSWVESGSSPDTTPNRLLLPSSQLSKYLSGYICKHWAPEVLPAPLRGKTKL